MEHLLKRRGPKTEPCDIPMFRSQEDKVKVAKMFETEQPERENMVS